MVYWGALPVCHAQTKSDTVILLCANKGWCVRLRSELRAAHFSMIAGQHNMVCTVLCLFVITLLPTSASSPLGTANLLYLQHKLCGTAAGIVSIHVCTFTYRLASLVAALPDVLCALLQVFSCLLLATMVS